jgi:hypothetical protein
MKRIIILAGIIALAQYCKGQSQLLDSAKNELYRINKVFDSTEYLGFNLDISYKSDSANKTVETDQMSGNYVLNQKNMYYQMGSTIYVQTDSFAYNIYPDEKMMVMTKNFIVQNSNLFPLRTFIDSMMYHYGNDYTITIENVAVDSFDYIKRIKFNRALTTQPYAGETMEYNYFYIDYKYGVERAYQPIKFEFSYNEEASIEALDSLENATTLGTYMATKTVTMNFSNFKPVLDFDLFNDASYVYYNRQRKIYEPTDKYRDYQFTTSGFDNEDEEAKFYREVPAGSPGGDN